MGAWNSTSRGQCGSSSTGEVNFDDFQILRAIGKGSFGKVCIVQKRDTKQMYAMKYMNKRSCIENDAVRNVFREMELLKQLRHPFLVNLWFTFQDQEDMFMVVDLLLGGDLRYHMQQESVFSDERVRFYLCELALALDYLQLQRILHRDLKPDNILLDELGHVHITDFNIATCLHEGHVATSLSGTKPYIAPEVFDSAVNECSGYSFPVDWWALGICLYEMRFGKRPYDIHSGSSTAEIRHLMRTTSIYYPSSWSPQLVDILQKLLCIDAQQRFSHLSQLQSHPYLDQVDFDNIFQLNIAAPFIPSKEHLNCDPTFELEEMIIEPKPLHKKKKRLAKQNSKRQSTSTEEPDPLQSYLNKLEGQFHPYNREQEKK